MSRKADHIKRFQLITECRQSGLTDRQWCIDKGICPSTFYSWIKAIHKSASMELPPSLAKSEVRPLPKQEVAKVNIIPNCNTVPHYSETPSEVPIEILFSGVQICIRNHADASLIADTLKALRFLC